METKHTKGEFTVNSAVKHENNGLWICEIRFIPENSSQINTFHYCNVYGETKEEAEANAKLIAAAPELLEACLAAYNVLPLGNELQLITEAIKKATE